MTKHCEKCNVTILGWSQHLKTQMHRRNYPDNTIVPGPRGRPRKHKTVQPKPKTPTRKELLLQAKEYNLRGYTSQNKQQLTSILSKAKQVLKKDNLQQLTIQLKNIVKEHNFKVNVTNKKKPELIDAILSFQDSIFRNTIARE
jgi:hypothetical protein